VPGYLAALMVIFGGFVLPACQGPCRTLAEQVCQCAASPREQRACEVRIDANEQAVTDAEAERCEDLTDTCTCEALELGKLQKCGLTELPEGFEVKVRSAESSDDS